MMHERKKYFLTLAVITALMNTGYAGVAAAEEADSQQKQTEKPYPASW